MCFYSLFERMSIVLYCAVLFFLPPTTSLKGRHNRLVFLLVFQLPLSKQQCIDHCFFVRANFECWGGKKEKKNS